MCSLNKCTQSTVRACHWMTQVKYQCVLLSPSRSFALLTGFRSFDYCYGIFVGDLVELSSIHLCAANISCRAQCLSWCDNKSWTLGRFFPQFSQKSSLIWYSFDVNWIKITWKMSAAINVMDLELKRVSTDTKKTLYVHRMDSALSLHWMNMWG